MKLSIIIPAYNCEKDIIHCVESINKQSFQDFEIIIVNDGSVDGTASILDSMAAKYSNLCVLHKQNGGVASARNVGLLEARGEFVTFIDADDYLIEEDYLECLIRYNVDYVAAGYTVSNRDGISGVSHRLSCHGNEIKEIPDVFFTNGWFHTCWAKMYRRDILLKNHILFRDQRVSEDSVFNLEYLECINSWRILDNKGYCYILSRNGSNALSKYNPSDIDCYIRLQGKLISLGISSLIIRKTMYAQYLALCMRVINNRLLSKKEKQFELKRILKKERVAQTILFTVNNIGEWSSGILSIIHAVF